MHCIEKSEGIEKDKKGIEKERRNQLENSNRMIVDEVQKLTEIEG